ncbi:hypothetical protein FHW96_002863 [Novosphingobium sp. SG751A]|uniref:hypothetical protein n=1 Tax=Novosphingobium sp. SG751A TaxID=2587000 RepID=UPI0015576020|nr:hypothetical protein [Novosphingobium sp. SG751A]NOW46703.1 hypothetical protein [Novosphingobium sp. SG751A]
MIRKILSVALSLLTGSLWRWPLALLRWIFATPARAWAATAILALAAAGLQHRRADHWEEIARQTQTSWDAQNARILAAARAAKAQSKKDAAHADTNHTALAAGGDGRFAAYAADHGLRQNTAHRPGPVQADPPALPESPAPDAIMADISRVWITRSDWLTCDADWAYARAAHDWVQGVGE